MADAPLPIDELVGNNGYAFFSHIVTGVIPGTSISKQSEFRCVILDLHKFVYLPLWSGGTPRHVTIAATLITPNNKNLRLLTNGCHFAAAVPRILAGDVKGYIVDTINFTRNMMHYNGIATVPSINNRSYTSFDNHSRQIFRGIGRLANADPPPADASPITGKSVLTGGAVILDLGSTPPLDPDAPDYDTNLKNRNSAGWGTALQNLSHDLLRARWAVGLIGSHHAVIASAGQGSDNTNSSGHTVHAGLRVQEFSREIKKISKKIAGNQVMWATMYDGSKPHGLVVAESAFFEARVRANSAQETYSYVSVFRRADGYIDEIDGTPIPRASKIPVWRDIKLLGAAPEFDIKLKLSALAHTVPERMTLTAHPSSGLQITPNSWTSAQVTNPADMTFPAKITVDPRKLTTKRVILQFEGYDKPDPAMPANLMLFEHNARLRILSKIQTCMLIDNSGSMKESDPTNFRFNALHTFAASYFSAGTPDPVGDFNQAALVTFSDGAQLKLGFSSDEAAFNGAVNSIGSPDGQTNFNAALTQVDALFAGISPLADARVFFFTDGKHNVGDFDPSIIAKLKQRGVVVDCVLLGEAIESGIPALIASETGGELHHLLRAADLNEVVSRTLERTTDDSTADAVRIALAPGQTATYPIMVRDIDKGVVQVTWNTDVPPPMVELKSKLGGTLQPIKTGLGFAIFRRGSTPKRASVPRRDDWWLSATAVASGSDTTNLRVVVFEQASNRPYVEMHLDGPGTVIPTHTAIKSDVHLMEDGLPVAIIEGDGATPGPGQARVWVEIQTADGAIRRLTLVNSSRTSGVFSLPADAVLERAGVHRLSFFAEGTDRLGQRYRRVRFASVLATPGIDMSPGAWPTKLIIGGLPFNTSVRIGTESPQPKSVRLMAKWLGEDEPFTLISFKKAEMGPGYSQWQGGVTTPKRKGRLELFWLAENDEMRRVWPLPGSSVQLNADVILKNYLWRVSVELPAAAGTPTLRALIRTLTVGGDVGEHAVWLPNDWPQDADILIRRLAAVDDADGSLWFVEADRASAGFQRRLARLTNDGQKQIYPSPALPAECVIGLDPQRRRLWYGLSGQVIAVSMSNWQMTRTTKLPGLQTLTPDSRSGAAWAIARDQGLDHHVLHRIDSDPSGLLDLRVKGPDGEAPLKVSERFPPLVTTNGRAIVWAHLQRGNALVLVDEEGSLAAQASGLPPTLSPTTLAIDPASNEIWISGIASSQSGSGDGHAAPIIYRLNENLELIQTVNGSQFELSRVTDLSLADYYSVLYICGIGVQSADGATSQEYKLIQFNIKTQQFHTLYASRKWLSSLPVKVL